MASESIGSVYPTQIPGYEDAADIQAALKLYHYGSTTAPANEGALIANSVAGHIKALDTRLDAVEITGIGSDYTATEPASPEDGFIWVKSDTVAPTIEPVAWQLLSSGSLSGLSVNATGIAGHKFYIILKDWSHNNTGSVDGLKIRFNSVSGSFYMLYPSSTPDDAIYLSEIANGSTDTVIVNVDLANTAASVKPLFISGSNESHSGYFIDVNSVETAQISLANGGSFDAGTYQVWSYE
jgi:hypothetical protein